MTQSRRKPAVGVVIVHYGAPDLTVRAVDSLEEAAGGAVDYECVVIDNASPRPMQPVAGPRVLIVRNRANMGFAAAANQGARLTAAELLLFLNNDARLKPAAMAEMVRALREEPGLAAVAARVTGSGEDYRPMRFLGPFNHALGLLGWRTLRYHTGCGRPADWVPAVALLIRRSAFSAVGGFDEGYFFFEEDEDLCWRLARRGQRVGVAEKAVVEHAGGAALAGPVRIDLLEHAQQRFLERRLGPIAVSGYRAAVGGARLLKAAARRSPILGRGR